MRTGVPADANRADTAQRGYRLRGAALSPRALEGAITGLGLGIVLAVLSIACGPWRP